MTMLETERLIVRNFRSSDWKALRHMIVQYQASAYAAYDYQWPTSEDEIRKIAEWFATGDSYWAVCLKDTHQFVGFVSLNTEQGDPQTVNLGYIFDFDYHGHGFATEACRAAISHVFDQWQVRRVITGTAAVNAPSCQLLERLGFKKTAEEMTSLDDVKDGNPIAFLGYTYEVSSNDWKAAGKPAQY